MTIVYAVGSENDGFSLDSIFSTNELAELFVKATGGEILPIELDVINPKVLAGYLYWHVTLDALGKSSDIYVWDYRYEERKNFTDSPNLKLEQSGINPKYNCPKYDYVKSGSWKFYQWAKTEEEAIQIANEKRIKLIEEGEW
jgi:hypothetical protein